MDSDFLKPVSVTYRKKVTAFPEEKPETKTESKPNKGYARSQVDSPKEALEILRQEPDYDSLVAVLRFLHQSRPNETGFNICRPTPETSQIIQVLVTEIAPNVWSHLTEDSADAERKNGAGKTSKTILDVFLGCLRCLTGVNATIIRLRALIQGVKSETKGTKNAEGSAELSQCLEMLGAILEGDGLVKQLWSSTTLGLDGVARVKPVESELLALLSSDRVVSLSAEAEMFLKQQRDVGGTTEDRWTADRPKYTKWLGENIANWVAAQPPAAQAKFCAAIFDRALRLGHSGES
jgi:telomere length regulation protein